MKPPRHHLLFLALAAAGCTSVALAQDDEPMQTMDTAQFALDNRVAVADLMETYELARRNDPTLAGAEANSLSIGEGVAQARAALLPQITGSYDWQDFDNEGSSLQFVQEPTPGFQSFGFTGDTRDKSWGLQLQQSIFNFGNWTRVRSARFSAEAARLDYEAAADNLIQRTANVYFGVLRAKDNLAFAMADETALKRQLEQAEQRFEVGLSAITDVEEARARHDSARATTITARNTLDDAKIALAELTGVIVDEVKPLREELPLMPPEPNDPIAWVDLARNNSPVLASDEATVRAAEYTIRSQRSGHLPTVDGFVNYSDGKTTGVRGLEGFDSPADSELESLSFGFRLNVPIFSGGLTSSLVRQAIHNRDAARFLEETDRRSVYRSTINAYRSTLAGVSSVEARQQALRSALAALEATQAGFEVGTRTIVDVLIAQQVLTQAYSQYAGARYDYILNRLAMETFAGTIEVADLQAVDALLADEVPTVEEMSTRALPKITPIDERAEPNGG